MIVILHYLFLKSNSDDGKDLTCHTEKEKHAKLNDQTAGMLNVDTLKSGHLFLQDSLFGPNAVYTCIISTPEIRTHL